MHRFIWEIFTLRKFYFSQSLIPLAAYKPSHLPLFWLRKQLGFLSQIHYHPNEQEDNKKAPFQVHGQPAGAFFQCNFIQSVEPCRVWPCFACRLVQLPFPPRVSAEPGVRLPTLTHMQLLPATGREPRHGFTSCSWYLLSVSRNSNRPYLMGFLWRLNDIMHITRGEIIAQ